MLNTVYKLTRLNSSFSPIPLSKESDTMVVQIKEYSSVEELEGNLDAEISNTKSTLGEYLRRLDEIRNLAEKSRKIREVVMKLAGKTKTSVETLGEISVGNLTIVLDANPVEELTAIELAVRSQQERLLVLQKAREGLKPLDQLADSGEINYLVVEREGVPERVLFKIC
jgi:hypothetical protein